MSTPQQQPNHIGGSGQTPNGPAARNPIDTVFSIQEVFEAIITELQAADIHRAAQVNSTFRNSSTSSLELQLFASPTASPTLHDFLRHPDEIDTAALNLSMIVLTYVTKKRGSSRNLYGVDGLQSIAHYARTDRGIVKSTFNTKNELAQLLCGVWGDLTLKVQHLIYGTPQADYGRLYQSITFYTATGDVMNGHIDQLFNISSAMKNGYRFPPNRRLPNRKLDVAPGVNAQTEYSLQQQDFNLLKLLPSYTIEHVNVSKPLPDDEKPDEEEYDDPPKKDKEAETMQGHQKAQADDDPECRNPSNKGRKEEQANERAPMFVEKNPDFLWDGEDDEDGEAADFEEE